jgi:hypothetical protein
VSLQDREKFTAPQERCQRRRYLLWIFSTSSTFFERYSAFGQRDRFNDAPPWLHQFDTAFEVPTRHNHTHVVEYLTKCRHLALKAAQAIS